jgi:hypothetical protein
MIFRKALGWRRGTASSIHPHKLGAVFVTVAMAYVAPAIAGAQGQLQICKRDRAEDYAEAEYWHREVVIPMGTAFSDVGTIESGDRWAKLRIFTLEPSRASGKTRSVVVRAEIGGPQDWVRKHEGPVVETVSPNDRRSLEVLVPARASDPLPSRMWPWADVPSVVATVARPFK